MKQLTLADEIVGTLLRDDTGEIEPARADCAHIAIAGGILMELSLLGRIDTIYLSLFIIDRNPVATSSGQCLAGDSCRAHEAAERMVDRAVCSS